MKKKLILCATLAFALTTATIYSPANAATTAPNATIIETPWQTIPAPAEALSMEEAAQLGAQYIRDVFGESIDGMYVLMQYMDLTFSSRQHWVGSVALTREATGLYDWEWDGTTGLDALQTDVMFFFRIDATTGERISISYSAPQSRPQPSPFRDGTEFWDTAQGNIVQNMNDSELMAFVGLTPEQLEAHTQKATTLAQSHFNNSTVTNVTLGQEIHNSITGSFFATGIGTILNIDADGNIYGTLRGLTFTITDDTSREAIVSISLNSPFIHIDSLHNDIIPGAILELPERE